FCQGALSFFFKSSPRQISAPGETSIFQNKKIRAIGFDIHAVSIREILHENRKKSKIALKYHGFGFISLNIGRNRIRNNSGRLFTSP
ncbi:MAG: hypothetical protein QF787_14945, partial [Nitrospinota bacterium]|nr:hypothetical protein [Nitrospinota bacterium]